MLAKPSLILLISSEDVIIPKSFLVSLVCCSTEYRNLHNDTVISTAITVCALKQK